MWGRFRFRNAAGSGEINAGAGDYAPDVLLASWVAPVYPSEVDTAVSANRAPLADELPTDAGTFLLRVYANQEC